VRNRGGGTVSLPGTGGGVTSPRLIDGLWRVYFPGGHVYRYQLRKAPEGGGHPGAEGRV
jgi:hypothetical protein